jgi:hypothetical protein
MTLWWLVPLAIVVVALLAGRFAVDSRDGRDWHSGDWRDWQRDRLRHG